MDLADAGCPVLNGPPLDSLLAEQKSKKGWLLKEAKGGNDRTGSIDPG